MNAMNDAMPERPKWNKFRRFSKCYAMQQWYFNRTTTWVPGVCRFYRSFPHLLATSTGAVAFRPERPVLRWNLCLMILTRCCDSEWLFENILMILKKMEPCGTGTSMAHEWHKCAQAPDSNHTGLAWPKVDESMWWKHLSSEALRSCFDSINTENH